MKVLQKQCEHTTKCTRIPGIGWGCRVFVNGELNQETVVKHKHQIGPAFAAMLRMEDKVGNLSDMARSSRERNYCEKYTQKRSTPVESWN